MKKINKYDIFVVFICFILYGYSLFVGSPIKDNTKIMNMLVLIIFLIYILVKLIKKEKYKLIKSRIDIFIVLLVFSSYLALIFQNYANLESTIEYLIKYTTILSIYIMIRDVISVDKKYINYIINTLIVSSISIFLLGLDNLTYNCSENFIKLTNNVNVINNDKRFFGIFGYANTTAILMLVISLLTIEKYLECRKYREKMLYSGILLVNISTIIMSYSRSTWLITLVAYLIYIVFLTREERIKYIEFLLRIGIISVLYSLIAIKLINQSEFLYTWIITGIFIIIAFLSSMLSRKIIRVIEKIKVKYYFLFAIIFIVIIILVWNIGIRMTEPLVLFNSVNVREEATHDITNIKPNTFYNFEFDIDSKTDYNTDNIYKIQICERNKYDDILVTHEITFGTYKGIKNIEFTTTEYTHKILLKFETQNRVAQRGLTINSLKINNEEKPLKYEFLPTKIVDKVQDINLKTISVTERFEYMKDACKLISKYGILGIGADGWKDRQTEVQDYWNYANEPHSYILEIFCEFGIIGFISVMGIIVQILNKLFRKIKEKQNNVMQITIILSVLILLIHSCIDFELSFMYMLMVLFSLIAMIEFKESEHVYINIFTKVIVLIFVVVSICFNTHICVDIYFRNKENPYSVEALYNNLTIDQNFANTIDKIVQRRKYISHVDMFKEIMHKQNLSEEELVKLYEVIKNEKNISRNDVYEKLNRIEFYKDILLNMKDNLKYKECKSNILQEILEVKDLLNNPEKCRLSLSEIKRCNEILENIEKEVK